MRGEAELAGSAKRRNKDGIHIRSSVAARDEPRELKSGETRGRGYAKFNVARRCRSVAPMEQVNSSRNCWGRLRHPFSAAEGFEHARLAQHSFDGSDGAFASGPSINERRELRFLAATPRC